MGNCLKKSKEWEGGIYLYEEHPSLKICTYWTAKSSTTFS